MLPRVLLPSNTLCAMIDWGKLFAVWSGCSLSTLIGLDSSPMDDSHRISYTRTAHSINYVLQCVVYVEISTLFTFPLWPSSLYHIRKPAPVPSMFLSLFFFHVGCAVWNHLRHWGYLFTLPLYLHFKIQTFFSLLLHTTFNSLTLQLPSLSLYILLTFLISGQSRLTCRSSYLVY